MKIINTLRFSNPFNYTINEVLGYFLIFFSLIPWVNFGTNYMDSQPWPLLFGLLFLFTSFRTKILHKDVLIFLLPLFALISWLFFSKNILDFIALRAFISYLTISVCLLGFLIFLRKYEFPWKLVIFINIIYLVVGLLQLYYPNLVASIVIQRGIGLGGRGVTGLAPEPTFFAIYLFFISFIYLAQSNFKTDKRILYLVTANVLAIIFLAKSASVLLFVILSVPFLLITRMSLKSLIYLTLVIIFITPIFFNILEESRIMTLFILLSEEGLWTLIFQDASVNDRLANVVYPLHGFYINNFLPSGFHSFTQMHSYLTDFYQGFFNYGSGSTSILSYVGAFLYELGFLGLLFLIFIFFRMQDGSTSRLFDTLLLFILLNSSVPPSFPLIPLLFAIFILSSERKLALN